MAHLEVIVQFTRRPVFYLFHISLSVLLLFTIEVNAQTRKRTPSRSTQATCDDLAAHPEDKGRVGAGVVDEKIASTFAIEKCTLAVNQSPDVARFHFQLGRAYWRAKRYNEAIDAFLKAEELGYAPAYFYLGQAYERGLIEGELADPAAARNLYMIAAAEGFDPAVRAYQKIVGDAPDFSEFKQSVLLQALYDGNLEALNKDRQSALLYSYGILQFMALSPNEYDPTCPRLVDRETADLLHSTMLREIFNVSSYPSPQEVLDLLASVLAGAVGQPNSKLAAFDAKEKLEQDAFNDFYLFTYDYGTCEGAAVEKVYTTIKRLAREKPSSPSRSGRQ